MKIVMFQVAIALLYIGALCPTVRGSGPTIRMRTGDTVILRPKKGVNATDTLRLRMTFLVDSGRLQSDFRLALLSLNKLFSDPVLLDSVPFKAGSIMRRGPIIKEIRVLVTPLNCLGRQENFTIEPLDAMPVLNRLDSNYQVTISPIPGVDPSELVPKMTLLQDTSDLTPVVQGGTASVVQALAIRVQLSGLPTNDLNWLNLNIPPFQTRSLASHPTLLSDSRIQIPAKAFETYGGCPDTISAPILIKLAPIKAPMPEQVFYVEQTNDVTSAAVVSITATNISAAGSVVSANSKRTELDSPNIFSITCAGPATYTFIFDPDSLGMPRSLQVVIGSGKDTATYRFYGLYDPINVASWLAGQFPKINGDCIRYMAYRVEEELTLSKTNAHPSTITVVAPSSAQANASGGDPKKAAVAPIRLDDSTTYLHPAYRKSDTAARTVDLLLYRDSVPSSLPDNDTLSFFLEKYTLPAAKKNTDSFYIFSRTGGQVVVGKKTWHQADVGKPFQAQVRLYFNSPIIDSIHEVDRIGNIRLKGADSSFHALRLTERGMFDLTSPFWVDLGTNFDLLDGVQLNNLYGGVYGHVKDIAGLHIHWFQPKKKREELKLKDTYNLSFLGGIYEAKSTGSGVTSDSGLYYRNASSFRRLSGGLPYFHDTGTVNNNLSVTSLGIFLSPQVRLTKKPADAYGFHLFVSLYIELLWQRVLSSFDFSATGRYDTAYVADSAHLYVLPQKPSSANFDFRANYFGLGIPILIRDKIFTMYINNSFGITNQKFVFVSDTNWVHTGGYKVAPGATAAFTNGVGFQQPKRNWNPFALVQFRLNEEKYGISITGEVRSMLMRDAKPVVSLALSKKFDLSDLFNTLVKPFTPGGSSTASPTQ